MSVREPKLHELKADKTFGDLKKGQIFKARILKSYVEGSTGDKDGRIEMAELTLESGQRIAAPYAFFKFVEPEDNN